MSIKKAIQTRDEALLIKTVATAVKAYGADLPAERDVNTVHGDVPFSLIVDEDTKWNVITGAYVAITQAVGRIAAGDDKSVEIAKLIAKDSVLRNVGTTSATSGLL